MVVSFTVGRLYCVCSCVCVCGRRFVVFCAMCFNELISKNELDIYYKVI
jgi:hypothetical protein